MDEDKGNMPPTTTSYQGWSHCIHAKAISAQTAGATGGPVPLLEGAPPTAQSPDTGRERWGPQPEAVCFSLLLLTLVFSSPLSAASILLFDFIVKERCKCLGKKKKSSYISRWNFQKAFCCCFYKSTYAPFGGEKGKGFYHKARDFICWFCVPIKSNYRCQGTFVSMLNTLC